MDLYELVRGPMAWIAFLVFILGSLYRLASAMVASGKGKAPRKSSRGTHAIRSLLHGLIPFGSVTMRKNPGLTVVTFVFHACLVVTPVVLLAHAVLWYESWEISLWSPPEAVTDATTVLVILACVFFLIRRLTVTEVKSVTSPSDFLLLALIALTFLTGFLAFHQWGPYRALLITHILAGEVMLIAIPFSRLSHMLLFVFTRAHVGSEFGDVCKAQDW
jgi:nitrate reductase gamma subunit